MRRWMTMDELNAKFNITFDGDLMSVSWKDKPGIFWRGYPDDLKGDVEWYSGAYAYAAFVLLTVEDNEHAR
jgi:hypothetical protein